MTIKLYGIPQFYSICECSGGCQDWILKGNTA